MYNLGTECLNQHWNAEAFMGNEGIRMFNKQKQKQTSLWPEMLEREKNKGREEETLLL